MKLSSFLLILFVAFLWFGQSPATGHGKSPRDLAMHSLAKHMKVISQSLKGEAAASEVGYKKSVEIMKIGNQYFDEIINVSDIILLVNIILNPDDMYIPEMLTAADIDQDGYINIIDVVQVVNIILN